MDSVAFLLLLLLGTGTPLQVWAIETVVALYGDNIVVPCHAPPRNDLLYMQWKYDKDDGSSVDLLVKHVQTPEAEVLAEGSYANRISVADNYSLLISEATLMDQKTFTCLAVSRVNVRGYPVTVVVYKKPSTVVIMDKANKLQKDKLTMLGTCVAKDANPAATVTWTKNRQPIEGDGKAIVISPSMKMDPATGLSTTSSTLQFTATKEDIGSTFACLSTHSLGNQETAQETFPIHYPSEKIDIQVLSNRPIIEGDNVTLRCQADGNPPPSSFLFHIKEQKMLVENSDTYTLTAIGRESTGEYKCSLAGDEKIEATEHITVSYLDLKLSPTGKVVRTVGDTLSVKMEKSASDDVKVSWTKDGKLVKEPQFNKLTYADAGVYECNVNMVGLTRRESFELAVEGKPVITSLTKHRAEDAKHKVLTCEAEGVPEPSFHWSINGTDVKSSYVNGRATHKITVIPRVNLTVTCSASNRLGEDVVTINVSSVIKEETEDRDSQEEPRDQAKLIVGVVVGLLIAAAVVGLIYCLYVKNSRQGSWKTGEKEVGTSEESKKLEENNHMV